MEHPSKMPCSYLYHNQQVMADTTRLPGIEGSEQNLDTDKRNFLKSVGAVVAGAVMSTAGLAQTVLAQDTIPVVKKSGDFSDITYRESELGIDYRAIADAPVDAMLSQGEAEWIINASDVFEDETAQIWGHDMAVEIGTGRVSKATVEDMREFTPNMLLSFARIDPNHPKYALLAAVGDNFELDKHLEG